ncbi:MAG: glycosyltransferase [Candidatus Gracilibacteria bacterium]|nr:glycosyltransferase [Candidatus Gracilibacteria bacterium]
MTAFLMEVFYLSFNKARDFREILVENGQTDVLIWGFGLYFVFRLCVFLYIFVLGQYKMYIFRKERNNDTKTNGGFVAKEVFAAMFLFNQDRSMINTTLPSEIEALIDFTKDGGTATLVILVTNEVVLNKQVVRVPKRSKKKTASEKLWFDVQDIREITGRYSCEKLKIIIIPQINGKRRAFKQFFEVIGRPEYAPRCRPEEVAFWFVDGDSEIPKELRNGFIKEAVRPLSLKKKIGGVTLRNVVKLDSQSPSAIAQISYTKGPQRDFIMQAIVNVLTGRGSMVIGTIALMKEFQDRIAEDFINHTTKLEVISFKDNRILFLVNLLYRFIGLFVLYPKQAFYSKTGDDKSTIYHLFKEGWSVRYNPDLYVVCHEDIPWSTKWLPNFWIFQFPALAVRYCRNSLNNNPRLLALGMEKLGFTRYVMNWTDRHLFWTPLAGPISTVFLMHAWGFDYLYVYMSWIVCTRSLWTFVICMATRQKWSAFYPIVLYYVQTVLVFVKLWALVSPRSSWTRQDAKIENPEAPKEIMASLWILMLIITFVGVKSGVIRIPDFQELVVMITSLT